jgi:hypothetical protein
VAQHHLNASKAGTLTDVLEKISGVVDLAKEFSLKMIISQFFHQDKLIVIGLAEESNSDKLKIYQSTFTSFASLYANVPLIATKKEIVVTNAVVQNSRYHVPWMTFGKLHFIRLDDGSNLIEFIGCTLDMAKSKLDGCELIKSFSYVTKVGDLIYSMELNTIGS